MIVYGPWGCGLCMNCRVGMENYCENPGKTKAGGLGDDGGMAPYLLVPSTRFLIPLGTLDPARGRSAHRRRAHQLPRRQAVAPPARAGLDRRRDRRRRARPDGHPGPASAERGRRPSSRWTPRPTSSRSPSRWAPTRRCSRAMARSSGSRTSRADRAPNLVLDMVGVEPTLKMAAQVARVLGHVTIVGLGGGALARQLPQPAERVLRRVALTGARSRS